MSQTPRNKMLTRMEEVRAQVAERDELIEIIAIALLTRKNVFILGDTGQAQERRYQPVPRRHHRHQPV